MPKFGRKSKARLATCHPLLQELMNEVIIARDCTIREGHRNAERQGQLFALGQSKVPWSGSQHNKLPSLGVDVAPWYQDTPHVRWPNPDSPDYVRQLGRWYMFIGYVQDIDDSIHDIFNLISSRQLLPKRGCQREQKLRKTAIKRYLKG